MVTVDLFKNPKTDNLGRMGNFSGLTEQTQYFNGLTGLHIQGTLSEGVGEITVDEPFTTTAAYSYGRYQVNGIYVYFSIRDIEVVNPTKSGIIYDVEGTYRRNRGVLSPHGMDVHPSFRRSPEHPQDAVSHTSMTTRRMRTWSMRCPTSAMKSM